MICYGKGRLPLVKGTESLGHFGPQWNCCAWVNSPLLQNKLGVCAGLLYGLPTGLLMTGTLFNLQALNPAGHVSIFLEWFFWLLAIWRWGILLPPCASLFRYISKSEMRWWSRRERGVCMCVCVCVSACDREKETQKESQRCGIKNGWGKSQRRGRERWWETVKDAWVTEWVQGSQRQSS